MTALGSARDTSTYRADYGSRLRDGAGLLALAAETGLARDTIRPLGQVITQERASGRLTSTQENAWMVLAAEGLAKEAEALSFSVDGTRQSGPVSRLYRAPALDARPVTITNDGTGAAQTVVSVSGNPIAPEPAESRGYSIERTYHRLDGTVVDLAQGFARTTASWWCSR